MNDATHIYIGTTACGCTVFATVDTPGRERSTAIEVAGAIRDGLTIDRIPLTDLPGIRIASCIHKPARARRHRPAASQMAMPVL